MSETNKDILLQALDDGDSDVIRHQLCEYLAGPSNPAVAVMFYRKLKLISKAEGLPVRRIAFLTSFTLETTLPYLFLNAYISGWILESLFIPYDQWRETLAEKGTLDRFSPESVLLLLHLENELPLLALRHLAATTELDGEADFFAAKLSGAIGGFRARSKAPVIINTLIPMTRGVEKHFDARHSISRRGRVDRLNGVIGEMARAEENVYVFDYAATVADFGRKNWYDPVKDHLNGSALTIAAQGFLAREVTEFVDTLFTQRRKVVAVDLDGTFWGGIVGEDGVKGIKLVGDYPGNAFHIFQAFLANLRASGLALAALSKNNEADAREVFEDNPDLPVAWDDFAARRIDWTDKASNLEATAREINVDPNSFVFIDDSEVEREWVAARLPDVGIVAAEGSPSLFPSRLLAATGLYAASLTHEDVGRAEGCLAERSRHQSKTEAADQKTFLEGLNLKLTVRSPNQGEFERVAQLCGKTNQFNLTTRRYDVMELLELAKDPNKKLLIARLQDRFGDYGLIGVAVLNGVENSKAKVETLLMSCRALGRKAEDGFLAQIEQIARFEGIKWLTGLYLPTKKNNMVATFYLDRGFVEQDDGHYIRDLESMGPLPLPDFITYSKE